MPVDRGVVDQQIRTIGEPPDWWNRRELRDLPAVLHADETILALGHGRITRRDPLRRAWLIIVTDRRLLLLRSATGRGWRQMEMPAHQIQRTALRIGPFRARVLVSGGGTRHRLFVPRAEGYKLVSALAKMSAPAQEASTGFRPVLVVRRVFDHMLALPAAALEPTAGEKPRAQSVSSDLDDRVQLLEREVEELRQQVRFLEQLLRDKVEAREARIFQSS